eukprot:404748_1
MTLLKPIIFLNVIIMILPSISFHISGAALPIPSYNMQAAFNNLTSTVYLLGGLSSPPDAIYNNLIYKRNIETDATLWKTNDTGATIFACSIQCSAQIEYLSYIIGAYFGANTVNTIFNVSSGQFISTQSIEPMKHIANQGCITTNNSHIFMIGGCQPDASCKSYSNYIQIYDIYLNKWTDDIQINVSFWGQACSLIDNIIYIFGGHSGSWSKAIYKYNVLSKEWSFIGNLPNPLGFANAIYYSNDNNIYIHAGHKVIVFNVVKEQIIYEETTVIGVAEAPILLTNDRLMIFGGIYTAVLPKPHHWYKWQWCQ